METPAVAPVTPPRVPVTDWAALPLVLRAEHCAALLGYETATGFYRAYRRDPSMLPTPFQRSPLGWARDTVRKWIESPAPFRVLGRKRA
jgi:hypothetical protein